MSNDLTITLSLDEQRAISIALFMAINNTFTQMMTHDEINTAKQLQSRIHRVDTNAAA